MPNMLLEISGEITPEKNEEMEPKQKQHPVVDATGGMGWRWPATGLGALSVAVHAWDLLKGVSIIFTTLHHSLVSGKQQGGNTALPIKRKLD